MCFLELQAAVERRRVRGRWGRLRAESFSELQNACRQLLSPALSHRGANHLSERLMVFRQRLYRRRWLRGEPPLLPDPSGATLVSPRELALLMELPSLGSEHALPLQRNTVPYLPIPTEVPRARLVELPLPDEGPAGDGGRSRRRSWTPSSSSTRSPRGAERWRRHPTAGSSRSPAGDGDPGLAVGRGLPNVPWTIRQRDRIYNVLLAGGQGSGKSSLLLRLAMADILAPNTATVVLDMKGSLSERLLRLIPPEIEKRWFDHEAGGWRHGRKRLWYLDLGRPAFGLTPLRVEPGWSHAALADEFARIADAITRALLDLFPGQIMGSSEDLIERAVVGTMAIAWFEHEQRCKRDGLDPAARGFSGSFEVLAQMFAPSDRFDDDEAQNRGRRRVRPNRWHQAAGRACQRLPNLDQVADSLLYEIPRQARDNLPDIAKRMEAPANKIRPLVGAAASVRRFVGHPERLSLRSVVEAHDTLIVNPRVELIGEDQASILTNFIVHMLDLQLKRQLAFPASQRPRVSLIIDEAQRLVTDTLIRMVEAHREAGLTTAAALQYVSQLGAYEPSAARREKIIKGVGNLLQTKVLFRMSDSDDADRHTQIFRSVYETMIRADPTSRARMPFDPARMQTLRDHHALVSLVSSAARGRRQRPGRRRPGGDQAARLRHPDLPDAGHRADPRRLARCPPRPPGGGVHDLPGGHVGARRARRPARPRRQDTLGQRRRTGQGRRPPRRRGDRRPQARARPTRRRAEARTPPEAAADRGPASGGPRPGWLRPGAVRHRQRGQRAGTGHPGIRPRPLRLPRSAGQDAKPRRSRRRPRTAGSR